MNEAIRDASDAAPRSLGGSDHRLVQHEVRKGVLIAVCDGRFSIACAGLTLNPHPRVTHQKASNHNPAVTLSTNKLTRFILPLQ